MKELMKALAKLALCTSGNEPDAQKLAVYAELLSKLDQAEVIKACDRLCLKATFFPSVSEIAGEASGDPKVRAAEAWQLAVQIASKGRYVDRDSFAPVEIRRAVRLIGGWDAIGLVATDRLPFVEKRFIDLFPAVEADTQAIAIEAARVNGILGA